MNSHEYWLLYWLSFSTSFLNISRASSNALPSKFNPQSAFLFSAFFAPNPTPQILSLGLASTKCLSPVASNWSLKSAFCLYLCSDPSNTIRALFAFHVSSVKFCTSRPSAFTRARSETSVVVIATTFRATAKSENSIAFWNIIQCSALGNSTSFSSSSS